MWNRKKVFLMNFGDSVFILFYFYDVITELKDTVFNFFRLFNSKTDIVIINIHRLMYNYVFQQTNEFSLTHN